MENKNKEFYIVVVFDREDNICRFFGKSGDRMGYLSPYANEAIIPLVLCFHCILYNNKPLY